MEPEDFFRVAAKLLQKGDGPCYRSAISRSYYGLFHSAKTLLEKQGIQATRNQEVHKITAMRLRESGNGELALVRQQLEEMRGLRNNADYSLSDPKTEHRPTAVFWLKQAKDHDEVLHRLFGGPEANSIVSAIRAWERQAMG